MIIGITRALPDEGEMHNKDESSVIVSSSKVVWKDVYFYFNGKSKPRSGIHTQFGFKDSVLILAHLLSLLLQR